MLRALLRPIWQAPALRLLWTVLLALVLMLTASVHAVWWSLDGQPLPYVQDQRLVELRIDLMDIDFQTGLAPRLARALAAESSVFARLIAFPERADRVLDDAGQVWQLQSISADFTEVLGVAPMLGRALDQGGATRSGLPALLLAHASWTRRFGANPALIGQAIRLGDRQFELVGVMPPTFGFPRADIDAWTGYTVSPAALAQDAMGAFGDYRVVARLAEGADLGAAKTALTRVLRSDASLARMDPTGTRGRADVRAWREAFGAAERVSLQNLWWSALLLCAVVAAGLGNVGADQALQRQREFVTRMALGARVGGLRLRLIAGLLPVVLPGAVLGLAMVPLGIDLLQQQQLVPPEWPLAPSLGAQTLLVALGIATLMLLVVAIAAWRPLGEICVPAHMRSSLRGGLSLGQRGLLTAQIALSLALVGNAGLLLRSTNQLLDSPLGFDPAGLSLTAVDLRELREPARQAAVTESWIGQLEAHPGVSAVALADMPPFGAAEFLGKVRVSTQQAPTEVALPSVSAAYFDTAGIPLLVGRGFQAGDVDVAVVDVAFRDRVLGGVNAIGASVMLESDDGAERRLQVIGIVPTVRQRSLDERERRPMLYQPMGIPGPSFFVLTRSVAGGDTPGLIARTLHTHAPVAAVGVNQWMSVLIGQTLQPRLALLRLTSAYALLCLLVAAGVMYAVLRVAIQRRVGELSLRLALGAPTRQLFTLVIGDGWRLLLLGLPLGLALGYALALQLQDQLYATRILEPTVWLSSASVLILSILAAAIAPARNACRIAPNQALRAD